MKLTRCLLIIIIMSVRIFFFSDAEKYCHEQRVSSP